MLVCDKTGQVAIETLMAAVSAAMLTIYFPGNVQMRGR